ncbi:MAG TPA: glutamyl-tRNA reductase [Nitrospirota bacterium]|nr:glutamyl-tRNA reductase [Nitrospirota bacterium]HKZ71986.1 glutamyl-tRNA reductase [Nitrospirota bacterium]
MDIILVGLSHNTAPVEIRECLSFSGEHLPAGILKLRDYEEILECVILSTCNRVEVYATVEKPELGVARVKDFLHACQPDLPLEKITQHLYIHKNEGVIRHLFRVAASLDSMVIGETQILGQVKDAFDCALLNKTTGVVLNKLFKKSIFTAKRVRTETRIGESAVSISFAAVELARKIFSNLRNKTGMLIGAGEMGELAAQNLVNSGIKEIVVSNRNYDRALDLARLYNGRAARFEDFLQEMVNVDVVICSTGAPNYVIRFEEVQDIIHRRKNRPLFFIDISVPRNIDPEINKIGNVFLYDIDDLQSVVETNLKTRKEEAEKGEHIVAEEVGKFTQWFKSLEVVPTIIALKDRMEEIRRKELERTMGRLRSLSPEEVQIIDGLTNTIINKILHNPLVALKLEAHSTNGLLYAEAVRKLFDLEIKVSEKETPGEES